jgi:hypothetical protein
MLWA